MLNRRKPHILASSIAAFAFLVLGSTLSIAGRAQTTGSGKKLFENRCGGCHALDRDKEGPHLRGVYGRVAGRWTLSKYSDALEKSKITWNDERLDKWLTDTEKLVPDNHMTFHVERPDERTKLLLI